MYIYLCVCVCVCACVCMGRNETYWFCRWGGIQRPDSFGDPSTPRGRVDSQRWRLRSSRIVWPRVHSVLRDSALLLTDR